MFSLAVQPQIQTSVPASGRETRNSQAQGADGWGLREIHANFSVSHGNSLASASLGARSWGGGWLRRLPASVSAQDPSSQVSLGSLW